MDVGTWLRGLGLSRYERAFRDNDVEVRVLPGLTGEDLKEIGVASVGHRRLILLAIAKLPAAAPAQAERRQLTVLFCDLVGSTELAARLDPEDLGQAIRAYQEAVAGEVARFEGYVAKYMGDGVLAYFGWPRAHEDNVERAVRAGLAAAAAVARLEALSGGPLAARVGIATGPVVVGELVGSDEARERAVVGETPNLAARLQELAEPGAVVVAEGTRRLLGDLFALRVLRPERLKGFAEPVRAFAVLGEGAAEGRFEAMHAAGVTPLVGREHELALLLDRWKRAKEGEGQIVLLSGEAGIGKSRLVRTLRERLDGEPHIWFGQFCSPHHVNTALHPVTGLLERAAGLRRGDLPERRLDRLEAMLALAMEDVREAAPLLADLLAIPATGRYPPLELTPQQKKERTFQALLDQLTGFAAQRPVLALYEDVHWADPTTLELLDRVVERVQRLPVLAVVTSRPGFAPPWTGHGHVALLSLGRLDRRQGQAMIDRVTGGKALPAEVLEQVLTRTDGVPLFVEELTKAVLESGLLASRGDRYELAGPLPARAIPITLQDSLMARLDRVGAVKEVAQAAACIGREFDHDLLATVTPLPAGELGAALDQLVAAELIFRGTAPDAAYTFKHALVQEAAYHSLLKSRRQQLHAAIARALEERPKAGTADGPEIVAHHLTEAGLPDPAAAWWLEAGQLAAGRSAYVEAVRHLRRGLDAIVGLPGSRERSERELGLWRALGAALAVVCGYAGPEVGEAFARALALCRALGNGDEIFPVLYGLWVHRLNRAEYAAAGETAREFMERAEQGDDAGVILTGHTLVGSVWLMQGRFAAARKAYERTIALYRRDRHRALVTDYVTDRRVVARQLLAQALAALGYWDLARQHATEALAEARDLGHPATQAYALWFSMMFWQVIGEVDLVEAHGERLASLALELQADFWQGIATAYRGWVRAARGDATTAIPLIRAGLATFRASEGASRLTDYLTLLSTAHRMAGEDDKALAAIGDAAAEARRTGEGRSLSEILRMRGEILVSMPKPDLVAGEASLRDALHLARAQDARGWELRAATSLARLWAGRGEREKAYDLLAPVHGWFTEGFDIPDLKDAAALLRALG